MTEMSDLTQLQPVLNPSELAPLARRALIVDDAVTARKTVENFLRSFGFSEIYNAVHGVQALELIPELNPMDLVVVDWNMPYMNGLELIQAMRAGAVSEETKVLMMTTETGMERVIEALDAGADEYVMKPFTKEILANKLQILGLKPNEWD